MEALEYVTIFSELGLVLCDILYIIFVMIVTEKIYHLPYRVEGTIERYVFASYHFKHLQQCYEYFWHI